jgi:hypothetical protein
LLHGGEAGEKGKIMNSIQKVDKVCRAVKALTPEDFEAVLQMAKEQAEYIHPLKMATASRLQDAGNYNLKVIKALKNLKKIIEGKCDG